VGARRCDRPSMVFDGEGLALRPMALEDAELLRWLEGFGHWVEPEAKQGLRSRPCPTPDAARDVVAFQERDRVL